MILMRSQLCRAAPANLKGVCGSGLGLALQGLGGHRAGAEGTSYALEDPVQVRRLSSLKQ